MRACPKCGNRYPSDFERCPVDGEALPLEETADPLLDEMLLDTYRVLEPLGEGGMAKVYLAKNERVGRKFAVKLLSPALAMDADVVERFFREARTAASLNHPHIVEVVDCARTKQGIPFMVMELLDGEDLDRILEREKQLDLERALLIGRQVADALEAAHAEGIVHRDVKPGNIFITRTRAGKEQAKVLDFGIARLMGGARLTKCGEVIGTPMYMSPEQARGDDELDYRSDVYSLSATLYHLLCGRPPFDGETGLSIMIQHITEEPPSPRRLRPEIPRQYSKLILRMLAKEPEQRPQSAGEVYSELGALEMRERETASSIVDTGIRPSATVEEVRVVTVLVADVESTSSADVETQVHETARAFDLLAEEVQQQGGRLEHLAGNRAVGLFGLALSFGDEPVRAVRAAIAAHERMGAGARMRIAVGTGRTLSLASGVSTGPAAGAAAKLLERVNPGGIGVDASTFSRIRGVYPSRPLPASDVHEPAFEIERGIEQVGLHVVPDLFGRDVPTMGRDDELEQLQDILDQTIRDRNPCVISITGEPGMGKSRLKRDFVLQVDSREDIDAFYVEGTAEALAREQPFSALGDALRRRARLEADLPEQEAVARLGSLVMQMGLADEDGTVTELLSMAAGVGKPRSPSIRVLRETPERLRDRMIDAIVGFIRCVARKKLVVLCIEDAQHVDKTSVNALTRLCNESQGFPLIVLLIGRLEMQDQVDDSLMVAGAHYKLKLEPLSRSETRALVADLLGSSPPRPLLEAIWDRTEGVPLFVEEFLFTLRHKGALIPDQTSGGWKFTGAGSISRMPATVEGMLQSRLDALEPSLKQAVRRAAVLGPVFWDDALRALGVEDYPPLLSTLARREVIVARHVSSVSECREYEFRSVMLRDVAYQMIPGRERASLHSSAAGWLADRGAPPAVLANHLELAGREEEAAEQYLEAGDLARESYANDDALHHYDRASSLLAAKSPDGTAPRPDPAIPHISALFGKELVLTRLGRRTEALAVLDSIDALAKATGDRRTSARASVRRGALVRLRDPREARSILEKALGECRAAGDAEWECRALHQLAQSAAFGGDLEGGAKAASEAVSVARRLDAKHLLIRTLMADGTIAVIGKGHWHGLPSFQEAIAIARESGDVEHEADLLQRCGFLWSELGDLDAAERDLAEARKLLERTGNRRVLAFTLHNLGWVLWKKGRADEARKAEEEALEVSGQAQLQQVVLATEIYLALFDIGEGKLDVALGRARRVRDEASAAGQVEPEMYASMAEALVLLELGRADEAAGAAMAAVDAYEKLGGTQQFEVEIHLVASICVSAAGRDEDASEMRSRASTALDRRSAPVTDPQARERLLRHIGAGLPDRILTGRKNWLPEA